MITSVEYTKTYKHQIVDKNKELNLHDVIKKKYRLKNHLLLEPFLVFSDDHSSKVLSIINNLFKFGNDALVGLISPRYSSVAARTEPIKSCGKHLIAPTDSNCFLLANCIIFEEYFFNFLFPKALGFFSWHNILKSSFSSSMNAAGKLKNSTLSFLEVYLQIVIEKSRSVINNFLRLVIRIRRMSDILKLLQVASKLCGKKRVMHNAPILPATYVVYNIKSFSSRTNVNSRSHW
ncbi:hypothetical protein AGLY_013093 [Aphis glycines]|uniref:Uncharacterized protein n=1 Tax=Aphis glycines TaxID=307491 RepID=A0A6G0T918_APHGL|nr:hypothetical protein AGLY_013093 [Aphis glycines]